MYQASVILLCIRENIWEMPQPERSVYIEFIRWYSRRLPFSFEKKTTTKTTNKKEFDEKIKNLPKNKFEFLYWLGVNGLVKPVYFLNFIYI